MSDEVRDQANQLRDAWGIFEAGHAPRTPEGWPDPDQLASLERDIERTHASLVDSLAADTLSLVVELGDEQHGNEAERAAAVTEFAARCEDHGAIAVSVPIDVDEVAPMLDTAAARSGCSLPIIARGIIVHPLQLRAVRAAGAHAVLMPALIFEDTADLAPDCELAELVAFAQRIGLEVGVSVCSHEQLEIALAAEPDLLNIDNRSRSGRVTIDRTLELLADVPVGTPVLSESIARAEEVARLQRAGVDGLMLDDEHIGDELAVTLAAYRTLMLDEQI